MERLGSTALVCAWFSGAVFWRCSGAAVNLSAHEASEAGPQMRRGRRSRRARRTVLICRCLVWEHHDTPEEEGGRRKIVMRVPMRFIDKTKTKR